MSDSKFNLKYVSIDEIKEWTIFLNLTKKQDTWTNLVALLNGLQNEVERKFNTYLFCRLSEIVTSICGSGCEIPDGKVITDNICQLLVRHNNQINKKKEMGVANHRQYVKRQ